MVRSLRIETVERGSLCKGDMIGLVPDDVVVEETGCALSGRD
jgi:hypothetical protein